MEYCVVAKNKFSLRLTCQKLFFTLSIVLTLCNTTKAQDAEFSQFLNAPLYLNPAFAGVGIGPRFIANYRNEWGAINHAYTTYSVSYDQDINKLNGGIGVSAFADEQGNGLYSQLQFTGFYSYQFNMNKNYALKMGASAAYSQLKIDYANFIFYDMIDQSSVSVTQSTQENSPAVLTKSYADFGAGFLLYSKKLFFGLGIKHLTQPNISFYNNTEKSQLPTRYALHFGYEFKKNKRSKSFFAPNCLLVQQGRFRQLNFGAMTGAGVLIAGINYRHTITNPDAFTFIFGVKKGVFKTAYSYDITTSGLKGRSGGTHEISIAMNFGERKNAIQQRRLKRYTECPDIF